MTLTPAYGRDYKNKKAVLDAFYEGKDFIINDIFNPYDGKPANNADLVGVGWIKIRYDNNRKVLAVKV